MMRLKMKRAGFGKAVEAAGFAVEYDCDSMIVAVPDGREKDIADVVPLDHVVVCLETGQTYVAVDDDETKVEKEAA